MATPHINAEMGDFADVVLMPGDPLRAKHIAETFLEDVREVNNVRGMLGFTGTYKGRKISVMGHGMGIPSCSIYTKELITDFGVKKIIRVGSCGAVREDVKLRDVVIGMGACTDSKVNRLRFKDHDFAAIADFGMVRNAVDAAKALGVDARVGNIFSADLFYTPDPSHVRRDGKIRHSGRGNGSGGYLRRGGGVRRESADHLHRLRPHPYPRADHCR
ncbi:purine nucleoside phosphorylase [Klebsiella pneumoniae]|uniref:Purine nucleoside phosphorylase n=1 Tax=Klebsiella pneumoniae TaxID=573 RepID=A0A2X3EZK7_KLEPN|nr:purine nucleoside phosphorylase [Klebsiella pneumoniae]